MFLTFLIFISIFWVFPSQIENLHSIAIKFQDYSPKNKKKYWKNCYLIIILYVTRCGKRFTWPTTKFWEKPRNVNLGQKFWFWVFAAFWNRNARNFIFHAWKVSIQRKSSYGMNNLGKEVYLHFSQNYVFRILNFKYAVVDGFSPDLAGWSVILSQILSGSTREILKIICFNLAPPLPL